MSKTRLFRAHCDWPYAGPVFVEADDREAAALKIERLLATLYGCPSDEVSFYNVDSYHELISEKGIGDDVDFRLFETGWDADGVTSWVDNPLFLAPLNQSFLQATWSRLQCHLDSDEHAVCLRI